MRKIVSFIVISVIVISLAGCSISMSNHSEKIGLKDKQTKTRNDTQVKDSSDIKYADMIPEPKDYFKNGEISIVDQDGGNAYIFQVRNFQTKEYEAYVAKCKDMGFTDVSYESENAGGKMFGAYTKDSKFWVEVLLGNDNGILAVTCKKSTKNK